MNVPGRVAGAALGYIVGNVPGAIAGYYMAKNREKTSPKTSKMVSPSKYARTQRYNKKRVILSPPRTPKRKTLWIKKANKAASRIQGAYRRYKARKVAGMRRRHALAYRGVSTAVDVGKFGKASGNLKTFEVKALKNGYHVTFEKYGTVTDSQCVYMYHSNYDPVEISRVLVGALFRTLFRKAGIEIGNVQQELPLFAPDQSAGFKIVFISRNPLQNEVATNEIIIGNNVTFQALVDSWTDTPSTMGRLFVDYMKGLANQFEPYTLSLYCADDNNTFQNWRCLANMTLADEMIVFQSSSAAMIQNRTKGEEAGTDGAVDRVDNQPLKGFIYEFKNGDPRLKTNQIRTYGTGDARDVLYATGDYTGVRTFGSVALDTQEPPVGQIWRNIKSTTPITLNPGNMKKTKITSVFKNRLPTLLLKLRCAQFTNANYLNLICYTGLPSMKSQIITLEETLRTPAGNLLTCLFEAELKVGAYTYTKKQKGVLRTRFNSTSISQIIPT